MTASADVEACNIISLTLPFPPSVNNYWRHVAIGRGVRTLISARGRVYRSNVTQSIGLQTKGHTAPIPGHFGLCAHVTLYPPDRRRRDLDNCLKALLDSLTHAGIWQDDSQVHELHLSWGPVRKGGMAEIKITRIDEVKEKQHEKRVKNNIEKAGH